MSLVSTVPVVVEPAAVVVVPNPILFDSGWKTVLGNGANTNLESITLTADGMVHIYAKHYKNTNVSYYQVISSYSDSSADVTGNFSPTWRASGNKGRQFSAGIQPFSVYEASSEPTQFLDVVVENRNSLGYPLEKDTTLIFKQLSSASTSYGIQYRIVVERSDGEQMVKWATNA